MGDRPKKRDYRQRAHCNPLSDAYIPYPPNVDYVDWSIHYRGFFESPSAPLEKHPEAKEVAPLSLNTIMHPIDYSVKRDPTRNGEAGPRPDFLDMGCGFGGMLFALSKEYPEKLSLGLEIREKVSTFVAEKIRAMRVGESVAKGVSGYHNVSVVRTNGMKFLSNYIRQNQLEKIFVNFPDPHFKRNNWRRRIITPQLLTTYAYHLKDGGQLYFVTDVKVLFEWMKKSCELHPLFHKIECNDFAFQQMQSCTEEGQKAIRSNDNIYAAVYECRKPKPIF